MSAVLAKGDGWEGLYIDGDLVDEGYKIDRKDMVMHMSEAGYDKYKSKEVDWEWLAERGNFPDQIDDVKFAVPEFEETE